MGLAILIAFIFIALIMYALCIVGIAMIITFFHLYKKEQKIIWKILGIICIIILVSLIICCIGTAIEIILSVPY